MTEETKAARFNRMKVTLSEGLAHSLNRMIVVVASTGMTVSGVSKYEYAFLLPEQERTYDFTAQIATLLEYRYSKKRWTCTSTDNSTEMKAHLCAVMDRDPDRLYCDFVYREVWHNPPDNWRKKA